MDVRLPDGTVVTDVPDNITKPELSQSTCRSGLFQVARRNGLQRAGAFLVVWRQGVGRYWARAYKSRARR
jgi:hypothetical protein